jgi:hypothetical protein
MNIVKNNAYFLFSLIVLLLLSGCFNSKIKKDINSQKNSTIKPKELPDKLEREEFLQNYSGYKLSSYSKDKIKQTYDNILQDKAIQTQITKNDIFNILGAPTLNKTERDFEIWQYKATNCVITLMWSVKNNAIVNIVAYNNKIEAINYKQCLIVSYADLNKN